MKLLVEGVSSKFKSPVYVAMMPCQDSDLNEAEEIEKSLAEDSINDLKYAPMNTELDFFRKQSKLWSC